MPTPRHTARPLLAAALLAWAVTGHAGTVQITVTGQDGKPASNVVIQVAAGAGTGASKAPAGAPLVIEQRDLQFAPFVSVAQAGSTVRFTNRDPYDHHVRSVPGGPLGSIAPAKNFELRLDAAVGEKTRSADVQLDKPGIIGLGCHLHGSMRGHLVVTDTPYFAKTDAQGLARIDGVPDGPIELKLWHPEQLTDQALQKAQVGAAPAAVAATLNFTPRTRRGR